MSVIGDVMFVASFFVLGGDFWDKISALFIHNARVLTNTNSSSKPGNGVE